jgi:hypothetical protein
MRMQSVQCSAQSLLIFYLHLPPTTTTHTHTLAHLPQPTSQGTDHSAVQCFSHWTHHITGGRMIVVDCQGCWTGAGGTTAGGTGGSVSANVSWDGSAYSAGGSGGSTGTTTTSPPSAFLLTDPAVHCTSLLRFGSTNLGHRGFPRFFQTHRCNHYCTALGLLPQAQAQAQAQAQVVSPQSP